ncbi:MAG TPA: NUDIX hydrolase [Flavobacterium sp.]|nr:NUDIX hydrolase [Flavobacterium sp.]
MRTSKIFVTVDAVVFKKNENGNELLLIKRKNEPFKGSWALPGGFVEEDEDLQDAAHRELLEETGVKIETSVQLKAFGKPGRDPRQRTVAVAFMAFVDGNTIAKAADDAAEAAWFPVNKLPELAFDHLEIINFALTKI